MARFIVAIAHHGSKNRPHLDRLLAVYRRLGAEIYILSEAPKEFDGDIRLCVGLPDKNPWSLPFAHRSLFKNKIEDFDYFIYSEDDTLISEENIEALVRAGDTLDGTEIAGFIRSEQSPSGEITYPTIHSFFRWLPDSTRVRGNQLWAKYTNDHSACFVATREQLRRAFASGGFPLTAHEGRYDMLCSAATDIYTSCGFERLLCVDEIDNFTVQHLPNIYIGKLGISATELGWQIDALHRIHREELPATELFEPETRLPHGAYSKKFHDTPDTHLEELIGDAPKKVLVWGAGDGRLEASIMQRGHEVTVVPFNSIFGVSCEKRGLTVTHMDADFGRYDCVVTVDCLHLCRDPERVMTMSRNWLTTGGRMLVRVPNMHRPSMMRHYLMGGRSKFGATPYTTHGLRQIAARAGFEKFGIEAPPVVGRWQTVNKASFGLFEPYLARHLYMKCE